MIEDIAVKGCVVYIGRVDGEIVYVGEGKFGRELHLNSGTSHLYEANKAHFKGKVIDIEIAAKDVTKLEAVSLEKGLITKYNPKWNTALTYKSELRLRIRRMLSKLDTSGSSRLSILKAGVNSIDDNGVFTFSSSDVRLLGNPFDGFYKSFKKKEVDPMFEYIEKGVRPFFSAKLSEAWLSQLEMNIYELARSL